MNLEILFQLLLQHSKSIQTVVVWNNHFNSAQVFRLNTTRVSCLESTTSGDSAETISQSLSSWWLWRSGHGSTASRNWTPATNMRLKKWWFFILSFRWESSNRKLIQTFGSRNGVLLNKYLKSSFGMTGVQSLEEIWGAQYRKLKSLSRLWVEVWF